MGKFVCTLENGNMSRWKKQQTLHPAFEDQSLQLWSKDFDLQEFQSVYSAKSISHMTREKFYGCSKSRGWYIWRRLPPFEGLLILRLNPSLLRPGCEFFKRWNSEVLMQPWCHLAAHPSRCNDVIVAYLQVCREHQASADEYDHNHHAGVKVC